MTSQFDQASIAVLGMGKTGLSAAQPGDTVVIAGRGHETVQETASAAINLDDRAVAREALALR